MSVLNQTDAGKGDDLNQKQKNTQQGNLPQRCIPNVTQYLEFQSYYLRVMVARVSIQIECWW